MRNYIILNNKNSNEINGLLIQELPAITKPKMRTQIEEIDGRAGDIVTQLGYAAYTKTISVGLYGDFDIDEVISYFNSSGTVVFSNEPDKYYNYEIIDQIDFNRLVRFRTAKVKMHVQPFKYPTEEEPLVAQYQLVTNTGSDMSLNNTANALFRKFDLKGNTTQVQYTGKNLANSSLTELQSLNSAGTWDNGSYTKSGVTFTPVYKNGMMEYVNVNGTASADSMFYFGRLTPASASTSYTINGCPSGGSSTTYRQWLDYIGGDYGSGASGAPGVTTPLNIFIQVKSGYNAQNLKFKTMVRLTSVTDNTYEPYVGGTASPNPSYPQPINVVSGDNTITIANSDDTESQSYNVNLGTLELCKIGDYQDYIYKDNGSWYLHKEIGKKIIDSVYYAGANGSGETSYQANTNDISEMASLNWGAGICSRFKNGNGTKQDNSFRIGANNKQIYIYTNNTNFSNTTNANSWLSNNNLIFYIPLATPTNTLIEDTTLIEQLEEIKSANSYEGQTNISHDSNDAPFLVDVSALQSGSDQLVVDNEGNIYSRPTLDLEGTGIVNVYLEGNQMFQVDLTDTNEIVIDTDEMEAYNPTTQALMNRQVTGNYDNFKLNVGDNTLKFSGDLTKATVTNYVRWL